MAQVKYEPLDDDIEDIDATMRQLIEQADCFLDSMRNRPSFNSSSSANESNASTSRDSTRTSSTAQPEQGITMGLVSSANQDEPSNDSSGSDTTILCSHEEVSMPEASTPIAVADETFGQEVIVISTPVAETRASRRARRNARSLLYADTSVIDLSNYQEPELVVIISSDEEDNVTSRTVQTSRPPPLSHQPQCVLSSYSVSVHTSPTQSVSVGLSSGVPAHPNRVTRRLSRTNNHTHPDIVEISMTEPPPIPITSLPAVRPAPSPRAARPTAPVASAPAPQTNLNETRTSRGVDIICPICYETLANRKAISTSCGHVFCAECLHRSLQLAKKCPICKKPLTKANKMHPVYFATE